MNYGGVQAESSGFEVEAPSPIALHNCVSRWVVGGIVFEIEPRIHMSVRRWSASGRSDAVQDTSISYSFDKRKK